MAYIEMGQGTHRNESWHIQEDDGLQLCLSHSARGRQGAVEFAVSHVEKVMGNVCMSHVTHMHMSQVTHMYMS